MVRRLLVLSFCFGMCEAVQLNAYAQENAQPQPSASGEAASSSPESIKTEAVVPQHEVNPAGIQWVWGEVVSVDPAAKSMIIKYLDYDTDEEKSMDVFVTDATAFQEVEGIGGIKVQDTVSIEYNVLEGKNYAKDVTVEQIEDAAQELEQPQESSSGEAAADRSPEPETQAQSQGQ